MLFKEIHEEVPTLRLNNNTISGVIKPVKTVKNEIKVTVYPNPANEKISITFDKNVQIKQIEVIDILGKSLISLHKPTYNTIDISQLFEGVYHLKLTDINNTQWQLSFVKIQ